MFLRSVFSILFLVLLAGCDPFQEDPESVFEDPEAYRVSEEVVEIIRNRDLDAFMKRLHPDRPSGADIRGVLTKVFEEIPSGDDVEFSLYYAELRKGEGQYAGIPIYLTAYDVVKEDNFFQLILAVAPHNGECCVVTYIRFLKSDVRPSTRYDLTFEDRSWQHYLFFALLIAVPVFMLATAIACAFNKNVKRRWLWIIFILLGFWGAELNWATGEIRNLFLHISPEQMYVNLLEVQILGVGIIRDGQFEPWILSISIPIGAIVYWIGPARRRRRMPESEE